SDAVKLTVNSVNDAPRFTLPAGSHYVLSATVGGAPVTLTGFATDISAGADNESTEAVSFTVTNDNHAAFATQPAVSPNGTLTFTPSTVGGTATVTVVAKDDGGTANGGLDASAPQSFVINVQQPEIALEQPLGTDLAHGTGSVDFGAVVPGAGGFSKVFTVRNTGTGSLSLGSLQLSGANEGDFSISAGALAGTVLPGQTTSFSVGFAPTAEGPRQALVTLGNNDEDEAPFTFVVTGTGAAPSTFTFSQPHYNALLGDTSVVLTVTRNASAPLEKVTIQTHDGPSLTLPRLDAAVAGTDYVDLAGAATALTFGQGEASKTVQVTLIPRTGLHPHRRFSAQLSGSPLGANGSVFVRILTADTGLPGLTVNTPINNLGLTALSPFTTQLTGSALDAIGLEKVTMSLNGEPEVEVPLGDVVTPPRFPFNFAISPAEGANTLSVTAWDFRGNVTTVTRTFNFTRRAVLTLSRVVPATLTATPSSAGSIVLAATPTTGASALTPAAANVDPKTSTLTPGTVVKLTATPAAGHVFSHWQNVPSGAVVAGNVLTFTMPAADVGVSAAFVPNAVMSGVTGGGINFYGLLHPNPGTPSSNSTEAFLTTTLVANTGALSGTLKVDGLTQTFTGAVYGDGSVFFTSGATKVPSLVFGTRALTLSYNAGAGNDAFAATLTHGANTSSGLAKRASYTTSSPVTAAWLNKTTSGLFTIGFPAKDQASRATSSYPQGDGFATITLSPSGAVSIARTLADGTPLTASSGLVAGNICPWFEQLANPGNPALQDGSFGGELVIDTSLPNTDIAGVDHRWYRPVVTSQGTPATDLYNDGWPDGIKVDAVGALYDSTVTGQIMLDLGASDLLNGNARLVFADGKLDPSMLYPVDIVGNAVTPKGASVLKTDITRFLLTVGSFVGKFTPNWANPNSTTPTFQGMIIQKGANKGGYGFFQSNAVGDSDPEVGAVTLGKP
ncbi:MAG: choice-of-anchor D domain-containing protein, partial [Roseimicrobium sp.]